MQAKKFPVFRACARHELVLGVLRGVRPLLLPAVGTLVRTRGVFISAVTISRRCRCFLQEAVAVHRFFSELALCL